MKPSVALVAPYAAWMALMSLLPQTALAYALRGAVTAALLVFSFCVLRARVRLNLRALLFGFSGGLIVFVLWTAPEMFVWPQGEADPSPFAPEDCGWSLTIVKLVASAFVISVAEELFFRKWLLDFAGFGWMLVLFGVEHMRFDLGPAGGLVFVVEGILAGYIYGLLAKRVGLLAAILAHAVTNLLLGLDVILLDKWFYW